MLANPCVRCRKPMPADDLDDTGLCVHCYDKTVELYATTKRSKALVRRHPLLKGLFDELPPLGTPWPSEMKQAWLTAASVILDLVYPPANHVEAVELASGGTVRVEVYAELLQLSDKDRVFVEGIIEILRSYRRI